MIALLLAILPTHATCARGSFLDGVTPAGVYRCARLIADTDDAPLEITTGRIFCHRGTVPIAFDGRTASCRRIGGAS